METSNSSSELPTIIPLHGQVSFGIRVGDLEQKDAEAARKMLARLAQGLTYAQCATVLYRYLLGMQLILIQDNGIWKDLAAPGSDGPPKSFTDWIEGHFGTISGSSRETAYNAISLGKSAALKKVGEDGIRKMNSVSNAYAIAKAERRGKEITPEIITQASKMPTTEFRQKVLGETGPNRGVVHTTTDSDTQARALAEIIAIIKNADHRALRRLAVLLKKEVLPLAGKNPSDAVDFVIAAIQEAIQSVSAADKEAAKVSDEPLEDDADEQAGFDPIEP